MQINNIKPRVLNGAPSFLLDSLRLLAALTVLFVHTYLQWFPGKYYSSFMIGNIAHSAVVIFFVLSGYVIAHTVIVSNRGKLKYAQARLSRLYSVLLPSLVITAIVQYIIFNINPAIGADYIRGTSLPRYILAGCFLNEVWFLSAAPPLNEPLWSLSFEFWYYVIFGFWFFGNRNLSSLMLLLITCFIAGPKILLMMPIWILGCTAYFLRQIKIKRNKAWGLVILGFTGAALIVKYVLPYPGIVGKSPLFFANQFVTDIFIGIFIAFAFWIMPSGVNAYVQPKWIKVFRRIADLTFPIYILNQPLLILCRTIFKYQMNNTLQFFEAFFSVLLFAILIGIILEYFRPKWTLLFNFLLIRTRNVVNNITLGSAISNNKIS